jgi:hypothetical protein
MKPRKSSPTNVSSRYGHFGFEKAKADKKDVDAQTATVKSLDFKTPFTLKATESTTIRAFLTHFDTFFSRDGKPTDREVDIVKFENDEFERSVSPVEQEISFTTGPRGQATHWKQVAFLIHKPIKVQQGQSLIVESGYDLVMRRNTSQLLMLTIRR